MKPQSGFTLIEAMATSAISAIVGTAILSVLYMSNSQLRDGSANLRLVQLQNIASNQIRSDIRKAYGVKRAGEGNGSFGSAINDPVLTGQKEIRLCTPGGNIFSAYQIRSGDHALYEGKMVAGAMVWTPFQVGSLALEINPDSSDFTILPRRQGVLFSIRYGYTQTGASYALPRIPETVRCRNRDL